MSHSFLSSTLGGLFSSLARHQESRRCIFCVWLLMDIIGSDVLVGLIACLLLCMLPVGPLVCVFFNSLCIFNYCKFWGSGVLPLCIIAPLRY